MQFQDTPPRWTAMRVLGEQPPVHYITAGCKFRRQLTPTPPAFHSGGGNKQGCFTREPHQPARKSCIRKTFRLPASRLSSTYVTLMFSPVLPLMIGVPHPAIAVHVNVTYRQKKTITQNSRICKMVLAGQEGTTEGGHIPCQPHQ